MLTNRGNNNVQHKKTNIAITRGDSAYITLTIMDKNYSRFNPTELDAVRVEVRTMPTTGTVLINGDITRMEDASGAVSYEWHIKPSDTAQLNPGKYVWDAQVKIVESGDVFTFIPVSDFIVLDEVTQPS